MQTDNGPGERLGASGCFVRRAVAADVPHIVALLRDDRLGKDREIDDLSRYDSAFRMIDADPQQFLAAICDDEGAVVGTMQLTVLPGLSRGGATRLQIEGVRVAGAARGSGLGTLMLEWAECFGRRRGANLVQLTTDKSRADAHRFYERSGYAASHEGFKKPLS